METIGERIKWIREQLLDDNGRKWTQERFAQELKIKRNTVATYEVGKSLPSDSAVSLICKTFNVNEIWLRTGEGEPYKEIGRTDRIEAFFKDVELGDNEFKKAFVEGLAKLTTEEWVAIEKICKKMAESNFSSAAAGRSSDAVPDDLDSKSTEELEAIYKNETLPMLSEKARTVSGTSGDEIKAE